jgi:hypothetical protein
MWIRNIETRALGQFKRQTLRFAAVSRDCNAVLHESGYRPTLRRAQCSTIGNYPRYTGGDAGILGRRSLTRIRLLEENCVAPPEIHAISTQSFCRSLRHRMRAAKNDTLRQCRSLSQDITTSVSGSNATVENTLTGHSTNPAQRPSYQYRTPLVFHIEWISTMFERRWRGSRNCCILWD